MEYFVVFDDEDARGEANIVLSMDSEHYQPFLPIAAKEASKTIIAELTDEECQAAEKQGAKIYKDIQFEHCEAFTPTHRGNWRYWEVNATASMGVAAPWQSKSLTDVLDHIKAPQAWATSRGSEVTIGIVDTGVCGVMREFPAEKRSPYSKSFKYSDAWVDNEGHGSMCASIAAGTTSSGGRYNGVAPDAKIMSLRSDLKATDLYRLYDWVLTLKRANTFSGPVVLSNSYGLGRCCPPAQLPENHPYTNIVRDLTADGIVVVFAAGNNHHKCGHDPSQCSPNTIWAVNSLDEIISVGTVNWDNRMDLGQHANSSRGPGEWAVNHRKPDCVAPTYGEVMWGCNYRTMEWWGTSGACPQVAGLAALLLSADPTLQPREVADLVRNSCDALSHEQSCVGAGIINCENALSLLNR